MHPLDFSLRDELYAAAVESPATWLVQAHTLREASKRVDWIHENFETGENAGYMVEYRLLMALSIENLIKGILVAHRLRAGSTEPLRGLFTHKLTRLAATLPSELDLLAQLTAYIEWAGRYPFPKAAADYSTGRGHGSAEHAAEIRLWERLFAYLREVGWAMKGAKGHDGWFCLLTR